MDSPRYIVLTHGDDGWQVDAEMDDYAEAVRMTKHYWDHDEHKLARLIDLFPDEAETEVLVRPGTPPRRVVVPKRPRRGR